MENETAVVVRVVCLNPPPSSIDGQPVAFGLQDKANDLHPGRERADGARTWAVSLQVSPVEDSERLSWSGPFVQGTSKQRFLYLSLRPERGEPTDWIRRIKVQLGAITWSQAVAATEPGHLLQATVDAGRSGTVSVIGGWQVVDAENP